MSHKSRLYTFLNSSKTISLLAFDGSDFFETFWSDHPNTAPSIQRFFLESLLSLQTMINFLKPTEHLGIYLESTDGPSPFQFNLEMFEHGSTRSLITPKTLTSLPELFTGRCRLVKFLPNQQAPYQTILAFQDSEFLDIIKEIFSQSYQIECDLFIDTQNLKSIFAYKLPSLANNLATKVDQLQSVGSWLSSNLENFRPYFAQSIHGVKDTVQFFEKVDLEYQSSKVITYSCHCSRARFHKHLYGLGSTEIHKILHEDHEIKVTCDYCQNEYIFTAPDFVWQ